MPHYFHRADPDRRRHHDERPSWRVEVLASTGDPLTLEQAKTYLRVFDDRENDLIAGHLAGAINDAENYCQTTFRDTVQRVVRMDAWPDDRFHLPIPPAISIDSVIYTDDAELEHTLDDSEYRLLKSSRTKSVLAWTDSFTRPALASRRADAVEITWTSGQALTVPAAVTEAIKAKLSVLYDNDLDARQLERYDKLFESLLDGFVGWGYA